MPRKHYSPRTEKCYVAWMRRYILFHDKRHPKDMGSGEIEKFLTYLAVKEHVSASTQNQAFNAILFLYREQLKIPLQDENIQALGAPRRTHIPSVMSKVEVKQLISILTGIYQLMAKVMYGGGH